MTEFRLHGPPGCGKSHALATNWIPAAAERFGPAKVVVCSLTKTAAQEIVSRDLPIERSNVGTLHALAYRALGAPSIAEGHLDEWNQRHPMFRLSAGAASVESPEVNRSTNGDGLMGLLQVYRHSLTPRHRWRHDVVVFERRWRQWLTDAGHVDFTGLIERAIDEVAYAPGYPDVFVVDEAQDCSALELRLVRLWAREARYAVLAGDGDQAIYGWRGASARAFLGPDIPEHHNYHLTQSYRVPSAVHRAASTWINRASYRYAVDYRPRKHVGRVTTNRGSSKNVEPIIDAMLRDVEDGRSVMLLGACGFMLKNALAVLRRNGVPFHNPFRPSHGPWNPLKSGAHRLRAFLRPDAVSFPGENRLWTWQEASTWVDALAAKNVMAPGGKAMVKRLGADPTRAQDTMTVAEGRSVFGASWTEIGDAFASGDPLAWLQRRVVASKAKGMDYAFSIAAKQGREVLAAEPKITVGTIHSVKGGQADSVYLLPDLSPSGMREWTTPGEGRDGIIRTFYVGMTRAKEQLVVCRRHSPRAIDWVPTC